MNKTVDPKDGAHVVVIGAGNIGSHVLPHLVRSGSVSHITIIDHDVYEEKNKFSQAINALDVGRSKANAQASALRRINPGIRVTAIQERVENVAMGKLRSAVILACLDSREGRRVVNQTAWRLGIPWIDAGVNPDQLLARINVYYPGKDRACLECSWSEQDYALLEKVYPCAPEGPAQASTDGPSSLGALAASLQVIECNKLLDATSEPGNCGEQVQIVFDAAHHTLYRNRLVPSEACLFDHVTLDPEPIAPDLASVTLKQLVHQLLKSKSDEAGNWVLKLEEKQFVQKLACSIGCGHQNISICLAHRIPPSQQRCPQCQSQLRIVGFAHDALCSNELNSSQLDNVLACFGFQIGDIFSLLIDHNTEIHYEIVAP